MYSKREEKEPYGEWETFSGEDKRDPFEAAAKSFEDRVEHLEAAVSDIEMRSRFSWIASIAAAGIALILLLH